MQCLSKLNIVLLTILTQLFQLIKLIIVFHHCIVSYGIYKYSVLEKYFNGFNIFVICRQTFQNVFRYCYHNKNEEFLIA